MQYAEVSTTLFQENHRACKLAVTEKGIIDIIILHEAETVQRMLID